MEKLLRWRDFSQVVECNNELKHDDLLQFIRSEGERIGADEDWILQNQLVFLKALNETTWLGDK